MCYFQDTTVALLVWPMWRGHVMQATTALWEPHDLTHRMTPLVVPVQLVTTAPRELPSHRAVLQAILPMQLEMWTSQDVNFAQKVIYAFPPLNNFNL